MAQPYRPPGRVPTDATASGHPGATPIPACLPGRRRPPCTPAAHPASHAHPIAPRAAAPAAPCHPRRRRPPPACRRRHPPPHPAIPAKPGSLPPSHPPCRHPFHPPRAAAFPCSCPARNAPPRTSRPHRRPSPAPTQLHSHSRMPAQQQHSSNHGTACTAGMPPGRASPSGAANQWRARCRPRHCHAHSATSHHRHAKHNSSIATLQQQRPKGQGAAHSQPQQLARTPLLLARHPHFMASAACGQGSTQSTAWQAALQQLRQHATTHQRLQHIKLQQASLTWHPAPHLLLAASTAAALHAAAACSTPARLPTCRHRQATGVQPAGQGMYSSVDITACSTSCRGPCSVANAARAQQRSSSNKQTAAPAPPARPTHLLQPTASLLHTTAALIGACLQQQECLSMQCMMCTACERRGSGQAGTQVCLCTQRSPAQPYHVRSKVLRSSAAAHMASKHVLVLTCRCFLSLRPHCRQTLHLLSPRQACISGLQSRAGATAQT